MDKISFRDRVNVIHGFYKGYNGIVIDFDAQYNMYTVELEYTEGMVIYTTNVEIHVYNLKKI